MDSRWPKALQLNYDCVLAKHILRSHNQPVHEIENLRPAEQHARRMHPGVTNRISSKITQLE